MSSATTKDGLSDDTLHNTVPSFTLLKIKYKIVIKTVKFGWSQSLTGLRTLALRCVCTITSYDTYNYTWHNGHWAPLYKFQCMCTLQSLGQYGPGSSCANRYIWTFFLTLFSLLSPVKLAISGEQTNVLMDGQKNAK